MSLNRLAESGSASTTTIEVQRPEDNGSGTLDLTARHARTSTRPSVHWREGVIDNEHMNKKKSKICCIFHKQRRFDESSSEESCSESDSDSDSCTSGSDSGSDGGDGAGRDCKRGDHGAKRRVRKPRKSKPNAYECAPHAK